MGCTNQAGEDNRNVARMGLLLAGLPVEVPGVTVNRLCASGLEAVNQGARQVMLRRRRPGAGRRRRVDDPRAARDAEARPLVPARQPGPSTTRRSAGASRTRAWRSCTRTDSMGETAENVAERYGIARADQDEFALESHRRAVAAARGGPLRRGDRAGAGAAAEGRPGHGPRRRGPAAGHHAREASPGCGRCSARAAR